MKLISYTESDAGSKRDKLHQNVSLDKGAVHWCFVRRHWWRILSQFMYKGKVENHEYKAAPTPGDSRPVYDHHDIMMCSEKFKTMRMEEENNDDDDKKNKHCEVSSW